jgi:ectoine hydroxylase-related dioxygenase (phytanoyl-CoA dioxygenase family)
MNDPYNINKQLIKEGFAIANDIFTTDEVDHLLHIISTADTSKASFRKTTDLFAIRQFFIELPEILAVVFNKKLNTLILDIFGHEYFVVKSIYFDKPNTSNWFVSYHQDLTISVDKKIEQPGFGPWTVKQNQFAVQPPLHILQENFTIRVHLDDTDEQNGALKIIPKSHNKGVYRPETIDWSKEQENICRVKSGGIMFMKPLLLHSSGRITNKQKRRVIHIEFSKSDLPGELKWSEFLPLNL